MPACAEINNAIQEFTGKTYGTSEQHKDSSKARIEQDNRDRGLFIEFLCERNPFTEETPLRHIETGTVAESSMNADEAKEVGKKILRDMERKKILDYTFKRKKTSSHPRIKTTY